jgi:hypothetical protein
MPKALRVSHRARFFRDAAVTGDVETRPARSSSPTRAPLGRISHTVREPERRYVEKLFTP